jgi:hypothetical protein
MCSLPYVHNVHELKGVWESVVHQLCKLATAPIATAPTQLDPQRYSYTSLHRAAAPAALASILSYSRAHMGCTLTMQWTMCGDCSTNITIPAARGSAQQQLHAGNC